MAGQVFQPLILLFVSLYACLAFALNYLLSFFVYFLINGRPLYMYEQQNTYYSVYICDKSISTGEFYFSRWGLNKDISIKAAEP